MVKSIQDFQDGKIPFDDLVGALEGAMDSGQFRDTQLVEKWYDLWTPLEIARAQEGDEIRFEDVASYLNEMKAFLNKVYTNSDQQ